MKCSKCGKSFKDIKAIGAHYRKAHPGAMKARKPRRLSVGKADETTAMRTFMESATRLTKLGYKITYTIE